MMMIIIIIIIIIIVIVIFLNAKPGRPVCQAGGGPGRRGGDMRRPRENMVGVNMVLAWRTFIPHDL